VRVFVRVADTLVADFDIIDFLAMLTEYGVELLGVSACGILLADPAGHLNLVAASTEQARILELSQLQNDEGPCLDAYHAMTTVTCPDLTAVGSRWPTFAPAALAAGFTAVHAVPMRLRQQAVGAFNLFSALPARRRVHDPARLRPRQQPQAGRGSRGRRGRGTQHPGRPLRAATRAPVIRVSAVSCWAATAMPTLMAMVPGRS
jgi:GAF domain-containing protein